MLKRNIAKRYMMKNPRTIVAITRKNLKRQDGRTAKNSKGIEKIEALSRSMKSNVIIGIGIGRKNAGNLKLNG